MALVPSWTKEIKLIARALDPLGLSRVSEYIVNELLPGITTSTNRGRNFSFLTWALKVVNSTNIASRKDFNKKLAKLEAAYVIGGLLDADEHIPNSKGPIGKKKARNRISNTKGRYINLNFSVLNNPAGSYGQYFRAAMWRLGLMIPLQKSDILSNTGKKIADIFEENVKNTKYFQSYLLEDNVNKKVLMEFGNKCSYLRLKEFKNERRALINLFFNENQNNSEIRNSRKMTLLFILDLFDKFTNLKIDLDDDKFRDVIYYHSFKYDKNIVAYEEKFFSEILKLWRYYGFQENFTLVLENILDVFIETLKESDKGISKKGFLNKYSNINKILSKKLNKNLENSTINQIFHTTLDIVGISGGLTKENSQRFDMKCSINHFLSEDSLIDEIYESYDKNKFDEVLANSIFMLLVLIIRYYQYINSYDESTIWIHEKEISEWSLLSFYQAVKNKLSCFKIRDFFDYILSKIIEQHNIIAYEKLLYGNDTFRFQKHKNLFVFEKDYEHTRRNSRFDSIKHIFEDLGLIEEKKGIYKITSFGKKILKAHKNG